MSPCEVEELLERLAPDLDALTEPWTIIGSTALMILGFPVAQCPDVDILTTTRGAEQLHDRWGGHVLAGYTPPEAPFRSRFARYGLPEGAVEVMGDMLVRRADHWIEVQPGRVEWHSFGRHDWPVPSGGDQLRILNLFGRPKDLARAVRLEPWLTDQGGAALSRAPGRAAASMAVAA